MSRNLLACILLFVGLSRLDAGTQHYSPGTVVFILPPDSATKSVNKTAPESALLLGGFANAAASDLLAGVEGCLLLRTSKTGNFMIGLTGNYALAGYFGKSSANTSTSIEHKVHCSNLGPSFAWKVGKTAFFTIEPTFLFGKEKRNTTTSMPGTQPTAKNETKIYKINTIQFNTGITWMLPANGQGSYVGTDFFFRGESDSILGATVGLSISAGFKF